jgi:uncharacterized protein
MSGWLTALVMGLAGSLHCAGMCSPLAMALTRNKPFVWSSILYNSGRVLVYALLGTLAAAFGSLFHLAPYQQIVSLLLGIAFLLFGLGVGNVRVPYVGVGVNKFAIFLKRIFSSVLNQKSVAATFLLGMINGLLPCGLTYIALSACLILPGAVDGFSFMLFFGLGTWPVMIGLTKLLSIAKWKNNFSLARLSKIAMIFIGCVLVIRVWWSPHANAPSHNRPTGQITICE